MTTRSRRLMSGFITLLLWGNVLGVLFNVATGNWVGAAVNAAAGALVWWTRQLC